MNNLLTKSMFTLTLLVVSLLAPAGYAQQRPGLAPSLRTAPAEDAHRQTRITGEAFVRTELFFGRNMPDGTEVTKKEFDDFLGQVITPRFPDGLTVVEGRGQFLNSDGVVEKERSILLILLYPLEVRLEKHVKIEEIRNLYKERFRQQSVLRVDNPLPVWVSF
ncbi:MAG TPA: DUF3574 domain-containing protein [Blastocatellia bacterium]|nr:DUF3574 domain-containing protein [Blastocatellia bacterium]